MAKTIIQTIGPLYGEVVNGTVFGRPNGSVYIPAQNTIKIALKDEMKYIRVSTSNYLVCTSTGTAPWGVPENQVKFVSESQDLQNYIILQVSTSDEFATVDGSRAFTAGQFNGTSLYVASGESLDPIVADETYYLRAVLMSGNGVPVATSDVIPLVGVVLS